MSAAKISIPALGRGKDDILKEMKTFGANDADYKEGKTFSLVYYLGEEHTTFLRDAHAMYMSANGLNPMAFQSLKRFETEVVKMSADMLHGDENTVGVITSGGTESCMMSVYAARERARAARILPHKPEMIVPESVHPAFEKGAKYFGVKAVHAPLDKDFRVNLKAVKKMINRNTILIVGSAPPYPHGVIDPIEDLARIAKKKDIPMHVDSCLGGFLLPWVEKLGYDIPAFDFRLPGVMSMSADIHKYGYSAKGASLILYRDMEYMKHSIFVYTDWPGGIYASPVLLGTRPGGSIAAAWATLQSIGQKGYMDYAKLIMDTTKEIQAAIADIPELTVVGKPHMSVFSFTAKDKNFPIYAVCDQMALKGWHIDRNQSPDGLHCMVTPHHAQFSDVYINDLKEAVAAVKANPELGKQGGAAVYGMISNVPLRGMIKKAVLKMMMDMYSPNGKPPDLNEPEDDFATKAGMAFVEIKKKVTSRLGL